MRKKKKYEIQKNRKKINIQNEHDLQSYNLERNVKDISKN